MAKRELAKLAPRVGDEIGVLYVGLKETQDDRKAHVYRAASSTAGGEFRWAEFGGEAGPEPPEPEAAAEPDDELPF